MVLESLVREGRELWGLDCSRGVWGAQVIRELSGLSGCLDYPVVYRLSGLPDYQFTLDCRNLIIRVSGIYLVIRVIQGLFGLLEFIWVIGYLDCQVAWIIRLSGLSGVSGLSGLSGLLEIIRVI